MCEAIVVKGPPVASPLSGDAPVRSTWSTIGGDIRSFSQVLRAPPQPNEAMDHRSFPPNRFNQGFAANRGGGFRPGWQNQGGRGWVPRGNRGGGRFQGDGRGFDENRNQNRVEERAPHNEAKEDAGGDKKEESVEVETSVNNNTQIVVTDTQGVHVGENSGRNANREDLDRPQFCPRCGKVGHTANYCQNPVICTRCKKEGHVSRVCMTKMPWEFISPFYGLSAYGQGFHVIESASNEDGVKDMSNVALIVVTAGEASTRQIENEFRLKARPNST